MSMIRTEAAHIIHDLGQYLHTIANKLLRYSLKVQKDGTDGPWYSVKEAKEMLDD